MKKEYLIQEYEARMKDCDILIAANIKRKRRLRRDEKKDEFEWNELKVEFHRVSAQRQCYVQFISNLEYELE